MTEISRTEPDPYGGPPRQWIDGTPPIANNLGEIRTPMQAIDVRVVEELYKRWKFVIGATLFKANQQEVQAPERQATNIQKAVEHAKRLDPEVKGFHDLIHDIWTVLVPGYVALQAEAFELTEPVSHE